MRPDAHGASIPICWRKGTSLMWGINMQTQTNRITWETSLEQARRRSARESKPVLMDFSAGPQYTDRATADATSYADARVLEFIERNCVPMRVCVRENRRLAEEYFVSWTPTVILADSDGRAHYDLVGHYPAEEFLAHLSLGVGKYHLNHRHYDEAAERLEEVAECFAGTEAGAEALYWLGVVRYQSQRSIIRQRATWQQLAIEYPTSKWTKRTRISA
jgi:hypothetical protein